MRVLVAAAKSNINATGFADKKSFVAKGIICPFSIIGVEQVRHAQKPLPDIGRVQDWLSDLLNHVRHNDSYCLGW